MAGRIRRIVDEKNIKDLQATISLETSSSVVNVVRDYGALGDGSHDDYAAIQAALDAVPSSGGAVYIPRGTFRNNARPWRIKTPFTRVFGEGYGSLIVSGFDGSAFLCVGTQPDPPLVSPLNPGGVGKAMSFSDNAKWIVVSRNHRFGKLDGLAQFGVQCRYKPNSITDGFNITQSCGNFSTSNGIASGSTNGAFRLTNDNGFPTFAINIAGTIKTLVSGSRMSVGTTYHLRACYDGANVKLFQDGVQVATTAASGVVQQAKWEDVVIGPYFAGWQQTNLYGTGPNGVVDQPQYVNDVSNWGMAAFTPPSSHTADGHTLALVDFTADYSSDAAMMGVRNYGGISWNEFYQASTQDHGCQGVEFENLRFQVDNQAIEGWICTDSKLRNLRIEFAQGHAIHLRNNSYNSTLENIYATGGGINNNALICLQEASGASHLKNIKTTGGKVGVLLDTAGGMFDHCYCVAGSVCDLWFKDSQIAANGLDCTDENGPGGQTAAMIFDGGGQGVIGTFTGCNFELDDSTCPTVIVDCAVSPANMVPKTAAISFIGTRFATPTYLTSHVKTYGTWDPGRISFIDCFNVQQGTVPLTDAPLNSWILQDGSFFAAAPAATGSNGYPGQVAYDGSFLYICTATNTWKRVGISTW